MNSPVNERCRLYDQDTDGSIDAGPDLSKVDSPKDRSVGIKWNRRANLALAALALTATAATIKFVSGRINQSGTTKSMPMINVGFLPPTLPPSIEHEIYNVGQVYNEIINRHDHTYVGYDGSGIQITPTLILTAGHIVLSGETKPLVNYPSQCSNLTFNNLSTGGALTYLESGSYKYGDNTIKPDIAMIFAPYQSGESGVGLSQVIRHSVSNIPIANNAPTHGQPLYFVNYEPTAQKVFRSPYNTRQRYIYPAIYGGIYYDSTANGEYVVLTGMKSYGQVKDTNSRPGASGGAVFNAAGQLIGLSVMGGSPIEAVSYSHSSESNASTPVDVQLGVSYIQPVNKGLIKELHKELHPYSVSCF